MSHRQKAAPGGTASASLTVVAPPSIAKAFGATNITLNGTTSLTFTITNPSANTVAEAGVAFTDTLPAGLVVATPNALTNTCGGTVTATAGSNSISLTGGSIAISSTCTVTVNVTATTSGSFVNTTGNVSSTNGGTGNTATATIGIVSPPTISKSFGAATIPLNGTTSLTFAIANPNASGSLTGIAFTDTLPAGLVVATPSGGTNSCGGTLTSTAGSGSVALSGGTLPANGNCTVAVNVQGTTAGIKNNSTQVTSTEGGTGNTTNASVTVVLPAVIIKAFDAASIQLNGSTSLQFTIQNNNATTTLHGVGFTDTLPAGLVVSTPNGLSGSCGGGAITATAGSNAVNLSGATVAANSSCTFAVNVTGTAAGIQNNTTGNVTSTEGGTGGTASATLKVEGPPSISKTFNPSQIALNATTSLQFTIMNPAANPDPLAGVGFIDNLPAGLTVLNASTPVCGGTLIVTAPGNIALSGATINPGTQCQFSVTVTGAVRGQYTNVSGAANSTNGGAGNTATANLTVAAPPTITKAFGVATMPVNATTSLTFTITNPNSGLGITGVAFIDNLPAGMFVANPNGSTGSCGTGTITAVPGSGSVSLTNGTIASSGSCTFSVNVTATFAGVKNNTTGSVSATETGTGGTASASVTIISRTTSTAVSFSANPAVSGQTIQVTATVTDTDSGTQSNPVGTVTFTSGAVSDVFNPTSCTLAAVVLSNNTSTCTVNLTSTTINTHSITANYPGVSVHLASSGTSQLTVNKANTSSALVSSVNPSVFGQSVTFTVTVGAVAPGTGIPTGTVTFRDGATPIGVGTLNASGIATLTVANLSVATHPITVSYPGDGNFNGSTSNTVNQIVNQDSTTTSLILSVNPSSFGQSVSFTATIAANAPGAGTPTGTVTFSDGATVLGTITLVNGVAAFTTTNLSVGTHPITAVYSSDTNFTSSTSIVVNQVVNKSTSGTALTSTANPSVFGQSVTFTATVTSTGPPVAQPVGTTRRVGRTVQTRTVPTGTRAVSSGIGIPTGTVMFFDGITQLGTGTLDGTGVATFTTAGLSVGTHSITAVYSGDNSFQSSTSSAVNQVVNKANTSVATVASSFNPSVFGQATVLSTTVTVVAPGAGQPTGTVTFLDGVTQIGTVTINGSGQATLTVSSLAVGVHSIKATYSGDGNFNSSTSPNALSQTVGRSNTITTIVPSSNPAFVSTTVTFTITVASVAPGPECRRERFNSETTASTSARLLLWLMVWPLQPRQT